MLPIGYVIKDTYVVRRFIARGGMSFIYEVWHKGLECSLALKVLSPEWATEPEFLRRFRDEARSMAQLHHPNITQVIDFDTMPGGAPYLVMELVQGQELSKLIKDRGRLPLPVVRVICHQVADALSATHEKGIVHRDLKPGNIIIVSHSSNPYFVKLLDFGIAKMPSSPEHPPTVAGTLLGTPEYMSPEQAARKEVDHRTDQYSLAVIAYELLGGSRPFARTAAEGSDETGLLQRIRTEPPPPLGGVSPAVEQVLRRALSKAPDERYPDITAFVTALDVAARASGEPGGPAPALPATEVAGPSAPLPSTKLENPLAPPPPRAPASASGDLAAHPGSRRRLWLILLGSGLGLAGGLTAVLFLVSGRPGSRHDLPLRKPLADAGSTSALPPPDLLKPPPPPAFPAEMVSFGPGELLIGSSAVATSLESPAHLVAVGRFALSRFEVSMGEFRSYTSQVPFRGTLPWDGVDNFEDIRNLPVNLLTQQQARAYCKWKYGRWEGRLPTEEEWEYAARDGQSEKFYPWPGNKLEPERVNAGRSLANLMPIDALPAGATEQGLLHMLGNVAEWTQSPAAPYPGSRARIAPGVIVRGGGAATPLRGLTAASRVSMAPDRRAPFVGVRCAATPPH